MSAIFGGSKSKSQSQQSGQSSSLAYNQAYPYLQQTYAPVVNQGVGATDLLSSLLGGKGTQDQNDAFNNYLNSSGYNFILGQGQKAINTNAATSGLFNSGATAKALQNYGQQTANTYYGDYLNRLLGLGQQGLAAGGLVGSTGNTSSSNSTYQGTSNSSSQSKPGMSSFLGQVGAGIATGGLSTGLGAAGKAGLGGAMGGAGGGALGAAGGIFG